jgi:FlaA1/EpsC-like NDP-sugar epimerase
MTRFNISLDEGVNMIFHAIQHAWGGEIFVPKIPSYNIVDVAKAICPECQQKEIGIRPGEKLHEEMITASDSFFTYNLGNYYVILPSQPVFDLDEFIQQHQARKVPNGFSYNSKDNQDFLSVKDLKELFINKLNLEL